MRFALGAALGLLASALVDAQTYTDCNPTKKSCPADPAFGKSDQTFDFTKGESTDFKSTGSVSYDGTNGATFTISKQGDGPLIQSGWYIMFGKVEYTIKAAPGKGIVSSAVLQSDDLDEVDWEWLGANNNQVQSNYFGKGDTSSYSRGAFHDNMGNHDDFHTYSVDWTSEQIVWAIDGKTVRVLTPDSAESNQYPQTPMMVKVGVWAGGDPSNAQGTIDWAGGEVDYSQGPFSMYMKSMTVTDYSTGNSYSYGDQSGSWKSITADGGKVNGNSDAEPKSTESAPAVTATVDSVPIPWSGTHKQTSSFVTPNVWPWVATGSSAPGATGAVDSSSGHVKPPGGGSSTFPSTPVPLGSSLAVSSRSGLETPSQNVSRHATSSMSAMITTTLKATATETKTKTTTTFSTSSEVTTQPTHVAPKVNGGTDLLVVPATLGTLSALVGAMLLL